MSPMAASGNPQLATNKTVVIINNTIKTYYNDYYKHITNLVPRSAKLKLKKDEIIDYHTYRTAQCDH